MPAALSWLQGLSDRGALLLFGAENLMVLGTVLALGRLLEAWPGARVVGPPAPRSTGLEWGLAACTVVLNTLITWAGFRLWQAGHIHVRLTGWPESLLDALVLLLAMDLAMYVLHRAAHHPWVYAWIHGLHHRYEAPRPLTLFVMHPLEVLGFGSLWLALLVARPATWGGMAVYLALNLLSGVGGHVNRDPLKSGGWAGTWLGTPTFHGGHHRDPEGNFGFYTQVWDRLFGSVSKGMRPDP